MFDYVLLSDRMSGSMLPKLWPAALFPEHSVHARINCYRHRTKVCTGQCFTELLTGQACFYTRLL